MPPAGMPGQGGRGAIKVAAPPPVFPLAVSSNGRYLQTAAGTPYRLQSEFLWQAWTTLTLTEFITYLDNRKARGFNAFEAWLVDHTSGSPANNTNGDAPFTTPGDLSTPNTAYFNYIDTFLDAAEARGFSPELYYLYAGYGGADWYPAVASNSLANCQAYGTFLGNRYKNRKNLIWMSGGDYSLPNDSTRTKYVAILTAMRAAGAYQLAGSEWGDPDTIVIDQGGYTYGTNPLTSDMQIGSMYCEGPKEGGSNGNGRTYDTADRAVRTMSLPAYPCETPQCDGNYYPLPLGFSRAATRAYQQWAITAGGIAGVNGGQTNVANPANSAALFAHYNDGYADDLQYSHALYQSLRWWDMLPSGTSSSSPHTRSGATGSTNYCGRVLIVSGGGSGDSLITSCMSSDGSQLLAYVPPDLPTTGTSTKTFSVDCRSLSAGTKNARWWNPTTGTFTAASPSTVNNSLSAQSFTTPGDNGTSTNDWMLVIG